MSDQFSIPEIPVNRSPVVMHRRQMRTQVWLPLILSIILVLVLVVLTIIGAVQGSPQIERWGNISAIWVIIPVLLAGLVVLMLTGFMIYGLSRLLKKMPDWMLRLQILMIRISNGVRKASDAATKPIVKVNTFSARVRALKTRIFG